ncbi:TetR/AcrR family transcriptional regulator [Herbaspirillum huttiense]|uniref:TetR/AcrR family transcriptional regulator n=1 Tax=Herbaspirillum huttiense TaxID=863372 RepID=UPI0039AF931E
MEAGVNSRERILVEATRIAQAHGYNGLNVRDLASAVGIKAASVYHHFASKAELGAAVARRYWEDAEAALRAMEEAAASPLECLRSYPETFRHALDRDNRICLCSFLAAETDDLPEEIKREVRKFAEVNVAWLKRMLASHAPASDKESTRRAEAIFAAVAGAQLIARSRRDITVYDELIRSYFAAGLLPGKPASRKKPS